MRLTSTDRLDGLGLVGRALLLAAIAWTPAAAGQEPPVPREPPQPGGPEGQVRPPRRPPPPGVEDGQDGPRGRAPLDPAQRAELVQHLRELADRIEAGEDVPLSPLLPPPHPPRVGRAPLGPGLDAGRRPPLPPRAPRPPHDAPPHAPRAPEPDGTRDAPLPRQVPVSAT